MSSPEQTASPVSRGEAFRPESYGPNFGPHLLEQYKLYVEMVDRISARRLTTNQYFLAVNTTLIGAFAVITTVGLSGLNHAWAGFVAVTGIVLCYVWFRLVKSYDQLNTGKFAVIHELERQLPFPLFTKEWEELGRGKDPSLYRPVSKVEAAVPFVFSGLYLVIFVWSVLEAFLKGS